MTSVRPTHLGKGISKIFGHTFHHESIRKYVAAFGTLFNDIHINRTTATAKVDTLKVPLSYMGKDKMLARALGDPNTDRKVAVQLPRMAFEMTNLTYDGSRKLPKVNLTGRSATTGKHSYTPVPYNLTFDLYIMVKNSEDGTKIVEQILPFFTPEFNITANIVPGMDSKMSIPIVLNSVNKQDDYEGDFKERRAIIWTLSFTLKGYIFGPVIDRAKINTAITQIFTDWTPGAAPDIKTVITPENIEDF